VTIGDVTSEVFTLTVNEKTVSVSCEEPDILTAGMAGNAVFTVTTEYIAEGVSIALNNNGVEGIDMIPAATESDGTTDITVRTTVDTPHGEHPLTVTVDGVISDTFYLTVIELKEKAVVVGSQIGELTAGTSGNVVFTVSTANIDNDSEIALINVNGVAGITLGTTETTDDSTEITISTSADTPAGEHPLKVKIDETESNEFTLTVKPSRGDAGQPGEEPEELDGGIDDTDGDPGGGGSSGGCNGLGIGGVCLWLAALASLRLCSKPRKTRKGDKNGL
jgi:hypothetical protein